MVDASLKANPSFGTTGNSAWLYVCPSLGPHFPLLITLSIYVSQDILFLRMLQLKLLNQNEVKGKNLTLFMLKLLLQQFSAELVGFLVICRALKE